MQPLKNLTDSELIVLLKTGDERTFDENGNLAASNTIRIMKEAGF